jgi:hypothetical protein
MKSTRLLSSVLVVAIATLVIPVGAADAPKPIYHNDFEKADEGKPAAEFMVMSGEFEVRKGKKDGKYLELPGEPLDTFGLLFGPAQGGPSASARFFGTKKGRKFPTYGVSLGGVAGYRLQVSGGKKTLEIFQGDEARQSVPFEFPDGVWTSLRIQVRKAGAGWVVEGKAWPAGTPEPAAWTIKYEAQEEPSAGRAGVWGSPFADTPIRFDDLDLSPEH